MQHLPVMLRQTLELAAPRHGDTVVDCTAGLGGHAERCADAIGPDGHLVLNDLDPGNLEQAAARIAALPGPPRVTTVHGNYARLPKRLQELELSADVVIADLGVASPQVDDAARGFSFSRPGPLDMRLDPTRGQTAADLVNTLSEQELREIIKEYGEERFAGPIARRIVAQRQDQPFETTDDLAKVVRSTIKGPPGRIDAATRTFQAIRIAVNDEMGSLEALLEHTERGGRMVASARPGWLSPGARVVFIAFHSLEDRRVKQTFGAMVSQGLLEPLVKGVLRPDEAEVGTNPRARSARLRAGRLMAASQMQ